MKLLVFVLNDDEHLEGVLEAYIEAGVSGATILDSEGMGRFLAYEVPLFADFKDYMQGNKPKNKTILAVIHDNAVLERLKPLIDGVVGGLSKPGAGVMFTVPVDWFAGPVRDERGA
jgi:nitrogen regulatory protein P-II 1